MKKQTAVIFGAGQLGLEIYDKICNDYEILAFLDNYEKRQGTKQGGVKVYAPEYIKDIQFDRIYVGSKTGHDEIIEQLQELGVDPHKIDDTYSLGNRIFKYNILEDFAKIVNQKGFQGNVAELGVFQGEYAKRINACFPDRSLYLFDTFSGFDTRDRNDQMDVSADDTKESLYDICDYLANTTEELVINKMKYPEKCIIKKGYFPETAEDVEDKFIFVSIDVDLYKPTLEGLRFFWDKMIENGVIIVDDYFTFKGVKQAVDDFCNERNEKIRLLPVGDDNNIILCK